MGVTTAPDYARALGRDFELAFVPLHEPLIERVFYIYQRRGHTLSAAAEAFLALLAERAASIPISGPPKSSPP